VRVFAAADCDHDAVARLDQPKIVAGSGHFGKHPFFKAIHDGAETLREF